MSCSGSHLGITINIKNTKFVKDLPMIDAQFRFNQCSRRFFSETTRTVETKLPRNDHWKVLYKVCFLCRSEIQDGRHRRTYINIGPYGKMFNSHLGFPIGIKNRNFVEDLPMIIPGQFGFNCPSGFREEAF
jgi:hypothetical protein